MNNYLHRTIWLLPGVLLLPISGMAAPASLFQAHVTTAASAATVGKSDTIAVSLINHGPAVPNGNVDLEVYTATGKKIGQQTWSGQALAKGKHSAYHWAWTPAKSGAYTVKLGVFSADWKTLHFWADKALVLKVS